MCISQVSDYHDSSNGYARHATTNTSGPLSVAGIYGDISKPQGSSATLREEVEGYVSRCDHTFGKGTTTLFNYEIAQTIFGDSQVLRFDVRDSPAATELADAVLGPHTNRMPWTITAVSVSGRVVLPTVIRRSAPDADLFFIMNRAAEAVNASITVQTATYNSVRDVLAGTNIPFSNHATSSSCVLMVSIVPRGMVWLIAAL